MGEVRDGGESLEDDTAFREAKEAAGLPNETAGFVYVDLEEAIELGTSFARVAGESVPPDVEANTRPLQSFLMYSSQDGDETRFAGFVGIE